MGISADLPKGVVDIRKKTDRQLKASEERR